jgi:BolA protein
MPSIKQRITQKLHAEFDPAQIEVLDESHQHHGHSGWREGGETHFRVRLVTPRFTGISRVDRHRLINTLLAEELKDRVHALALELKAPGES